MAEIFQNTAQKCNNPYLGSMECVKLTAYPFTLKAVTQPEKLQQFHFMLMCCDVLCPRNSELDHQSIAIVPRVQSNGKMLPDKLVVSAPPIEQIRSS